MRRLALPLLLLPLVGCPNRPDTETDTDPATDVDSDSDSQAWVLDPPTDVRATPGAGQVRLDWTAPAGANAYRIERGDASGGPYTEIGFAATTRFTDTGLTGGRTYFYVVIAANQDGESPPSAEVGATAQ